MNPPIRLAARAFSSYPLRTGHVADLDPAFPSYLSAWSGGHLALGRGDTHFGYVHQGEATLINDEGHEFPLRAGYAFAAVGPANVDGLKGEGVVVSRRDYVGFNYITGPLEQQGRLKYIDGCTDSLLIPPIKLGDPCLNLLHFPPGIDQTAHTHPSDWIGIILSGRGLCHAWNVDPSIRDDGQVDEVSLVEERVDLVPGMLFVVHTDGKHKFSTPYDLPMRVLAYHPESDFGPRDEDHPMLNRTIVDGVSAREIDEIRTK